ncbi:nucleotidyl transferase AbiEii/AbiGii toxin family protein [Demequina salsinemoris]|uniref:nucleotidyl transferase AbiEii/AbiGii toxin family protein n=1 Tax=Demequina salsinemoris TaxID=577470 RepID=UPI001F17C427|nr:nucleotidyl transferase AbiEii/AbiGii toxin family protein [Demequina salsinemoris]
MAAPVERALDAIDSAADFAVVTDPTPIYLRSGATPSKKVTVVRGTSEPLDRLEVQLVVDWPHSESALLELPGSGSGVQVEPLEWVIANKLHALFKCRDARRVSSRCRDLFDLELIGLPEQEVPRSSVRRHLRELDTCWRIASDPPGEWEVAWSKLATATPIQRSLDEAWSRSAEYFRALGLGSR